MAEVVVNRQLLTQATTDLTMLHAERVVQGSGCCDAQPCEVQRRITRLHGLLQRTPPAG